jgi:Na+/phosphate symporter
MQEHLIHKDLINNKLEKLFKSSEEKRRMTNILFARHMSGLNFFVDNAHKQLTILKDAQKDMLKNKEIIDYFGDTAEKGGDDAHDTVSNSEKSIKKYLMQSVSSLSLTDLALNGNKADSNKNNSRDNLFVHMPEDDQLIDEDLLY